MNVYLTITSHIYNKIDSCIGRSYDRILGSFPVPFYTVHISWTCNCLLEISLHFHRINEGVQASCTFCRIWSRKSRILQLFLLCLWIHHSLIADKVLILNYSPCWQILLHYSTFAVGRCWGIGCMAIGIREQPNSHRSGSAPVWSPGGIFEYVMTDIFCRTCAHRRKIFVAMHWLSLQSKLGILTIDDTDLIDLGIHLLDLTKPPHRSTPLSTNSDMRNLIAMSKTCLVYLYMSVLNWTTFKINQIKSIFHMWWQISVS
jgi:hypothetical protein